MNLINLTGKRFGKLKVIKRGKGKIKWVAYWKCLCDCGKISSVASSHLRTGHTRTCGCLVSETVLAKFTTHGKRYSKIYRVWCDMKNRCYNPNVKNFRDYGGRGIKICAKWRNSFLAFFKDMGDKPKGLSIDRINNDGDYKPSNCRWATRKQQANNRRKRRVK